MSFLQSLKSFESNPKLLEAWYEEFIDVVQAQIQTLFLSLVSNFLQIAGLGDSLSISSEHTAQVGRNLIDEESEDWGLVKLLVSSSQPAASVDNDNDEQVMSRSSFSRAPYATLLLWPILAIF